MIPSRLVVTVRDKGRLIDTIRRARPLSALQARHLGSLEVTLRRAHLVSSHEVPPDVITMNSRFQLRDVGGDSIQTYALVYPQAETAGGTPLCVVSSPGLLFLGARAGDVIGWNDGERSRRSEVTGVIYQPEAAGHY